MTVLMRPMMQVLGSVFVALSSVLMGPDTAVSKRRWPCRSSERGPMTHVRYERWTISLRYTADQAGGQTQTWPFLDTSSTPNLLVDD